MASEEKLAAVKGRSWFYEFLLPDGVRTRADIPPEVLPIHETRRRGLASVIAEEVGDASALSALDFGSHQGFYSFELARHFREVTGIEVRPESIAAAELMADALGVGNVRFLRADLQKADPAELPSADFVLLYGLLYHLEDPIHTIRLASQLSRRHVLVESQVLPYEITAHVEDGHYQWRRPVHGHFGLSSDYAAHREGGSTDIALVPSLNALIFLLRAFGFETVRVLAAGPDDYEQFRRGSRVMIYGRK